MYARPQNYFTVQKGQNSLHIAAREGRLECLETLHAEALRIVDQESPYQRLDKVSRRK